uniref:Uncharacterized protein n=1 Tax=Dunaliella tertiolecta TaxID=3047 RepID=A0A7S3VTE9_DUNTE
MASQAPSSSSNPLARWLKPVSPTQQLLANQARLARAQASKKGQPAKQKNPAGRPSGDSSVDVASMSSSVCLALFDSGSLWIGWNCLPMVRCVIHREQKRT